MRIPFRLLLSTLALAAVIGCDRDDPVVAYQAPKEQVAKEQTAPRAVEWTVPEGWRSLPGDNLRFATFAVSPEDPKLVVTVIPLPPNQPELANINRWEGQIGLPPSDEAQMAKLLKRVDVNGTTAETIELTGPPAEGKPKQSILAAIFQRPDKTWYIKLQGDADKVAQQRDKFDAFVRSVKFGEAAGAEVQQQQPRDDAKAQAAPAMPPAASGVAPQWKAPADWTQEPERPMRVATYKTPGDAQVILSSFGAEAFKDKLANINRWRNMVELPPVENADAQATQQTTVGTLPATLYQFENKDQKLVVVTVDRGATIWFVRFAGPSKAIDAQKDNFQSFLKSFQW